jgi:pilus assembly protein CpaE
MNVFLVSEDESLARTIRQIMIRERVHCPLSSVISFDQAVRRLALSPPDLIVAVLPEDPVRCVEALEMLAAIPRTDRTLVVAVGPAADAKLVIRALRGVVDDYLDVSDLEHELVAVLSSWSRRWTLERPEGKLVAVLAPSGGSGSSTIAANIAVELARELKTVGLIDLKLETGDLAALLDLKPTHSLSDLCKNIERLDQSFFQQSLVAHASGVRLLSAPKHLADVDLVTPESVRQAIGLARVTFPLVVVDLEHRFAAEQIQILRQADVILVVLRLDFTSLKNATKFLEHLDGLGVPSTRIRLVVNRHGQPKEVPLAKVEEALHMKAFHVLPDDPRTINRANNHGNPVVLEDRKSKIARSLAGLALAIQTQLKLEAFPDAPPVALDASTSAHPDSGARRPGPAADYRPNLVARMLTPDTSRGSRS